MSAFHAPLEDILTTRQLIADQQDMTDYDSDISASVITQFARFAEEQIAPVNGIGEWRAVTNARRGSDARGVQTCLQPVNRGWLARLSAPEEFDVWGWINLPLPACLKFFRGVSCLQMICNLVPGAIAI